MVSNADRYHFADFTRENYRRLLRLAGDRYTFRTYTNFRKDERFLLWRHDVDFSAHAARRLAEIEADEGVVATYFLYFHSEAYNLLEREATACIRDVMAFGHRIGLHFDAAYHRIADRETLVGALTREKRALEDAFGAEVEVFSFHMTTPFADTCRDWQYAGMINASADYFRQEVGYCSDSNGYWRVRRLEDVLREAKDERLQVLTHAEWWQEQVLSPRERFDRCIEGRAQKAKDWYEGVLRAAGRENPDWDRE
jgi:hypothetical protein